MDRFDSLLAFVTVAERGGFAAASRQLGISTSAATRHIAALEERLGLRLFNRSTRAVSLTDAGQRFLEHARRILADLENAEKIAEDEIGEPAGRLSITAPLVFGRLHVAPLVCSYMAKFTQVSVELMLADRVVNLIEEGIDVAVRIGHLPDSSDVARKVGAVRRVAVASPGYLAAAGTPEGPKDLARHRLIGFTALSSGGAWRFGKGRNLAQLAVSPVFSTNSADAAIEHAVHGGGVTLTLSYQVAEPVSQGRLVIILEEHEPEPLPVQFVFPARRHLSLKVRRLFELQAEAGDWDFM